MKIFYIPREPTKTVMYVIIDVEVIPHPKGLFPTVENSDIDTMSVIVTDFKEIYQRHNLTIDTIQSVREHIENNIVVSYCYWFESSFLNKYGINPSRYIDINYLLKWGTLKETCDICKIPFNQNDICRTLYLLTEVHIEMIKALGENTTDNDGAYKL